METNLRAILTARAESRPYSQIYMNEGRITGAITRTPVTQHRDGHIHTGVSIADLTRCQCGAMAEEHDTDEHGNWLVCPSCLFPAKAVA